MEFKEFCIYVKNNLKNYMPKSLDVEEVIIRTITKDNSTEKTGVVVNCFSDNMVPILYLEQFFSAYKEGEKLSDVCKEIAYAIMIARESAPQNMDKINLDTMESKIFPVVRNANLNKSFMSERPHRKIQDLIIMYQIVLEEKDDETSSIAITNGMLDKWNMTEEKLHDIALENMKREYTPGLYSLDDLANNFFKSNKDKDIFEGERNFYKQGYVPKEKKNDIMILNNGCNRNGASVLADTQTLAIISIMLEDELVILPSSIHECLILKKTGIPFELSGLSEMVRSVNEEQVAEEERLSDHVYCYSIERGLYY